MPQDNRRDGRYRGGSAQTERSKVALAVENVSYNRKTETLTATVVARRGSHPERTLDVQLLVQGNAYTGQTDYHGRASFVAYNIVYAAGSHILKAETLTGDPINVSHTLVVEKLDVPADKRPMLSLSTTAYSIGDVHHIITSVHAKRGEDSIPDLIVDVETGTDSQRVALDGNGQGTVHLRVPNPDRHPAMVTVVKATAEDPPMQATTPVVLQRAPIKLPRKVTIMRAACTAEEGVYTVQVNAEDKHGPLQGLPIFVSGQANTIETQPITNEYGVVVLRLECFPNQEKTIVQIDIPGVSKTQPITLYRRVDVYIQTEPAQVPRLGWDENPILHLLIGYLVGSGRAVFVGPRPYIGSTGHTETPEEGRHATRNWFMRFLAYFFGASSVIAYAASYVVGACWGTNNRRARTFIFACIALVLYTVWVVGVDVTYLFRVGLASINATPAPATPVHWLDWWQAILVTFGASVFTFFYAMFSMREELKRAWHNAQQRLSLKRSSVVLDGDQASITERIVDRVLPEQNESPSPVVATTPASVPAPAPAVAVQPPAPSRMAVNFSEVGQWALLFGHTLLEVLNLKRKVR